MSSIPRVILEPTLNKTISIPKPSYEYECSVEDAAERPQLFSLARTIAARPQLGLLVQSLNLGTLGGQELEEYMSEVEMRNTIGATRGATSFWLHGETGLQI